MGDGATSRPYKTKGFPLLKTQLRSLFLALISQVGGKFAAEAFILECVWGVGVD